MEPNNLPVQPAASPTSVNNPLGVMQPGEQLICEIKRHPIGLVGMYTVTGFILVIALSIAILTPIYASFLTMQQTLGIVLACVLGMIITGIVAYIGLYIYRANRWVVTSDSITEFTQVGLFNKQTSQLSLANLEDVTVEQESLLESLFGFGTLHVETAGEHSKFIFDLCPDPNMYARKIIAAHEAYIANRQKEMHTFNEALVTAHGYNQPAPPDAPKANS